MLNQTSILMLKILNNYTNF